MLLFLMRKNTKSHKLNSTTSDKERFILSDDRGPHEGHAIGTVRTCDHSHHTRNRIRIQAIQHALWSQLSDSDSDSQRCEVQLKKDITLQVCNLQILQLATWSES
uniref:Uncharacterized protein n=1 Tax=Mucochytrium quahogii TaxID=96639 RepID=A0A7S2S0Q2_9STRA|mmetsp:Transcript_13845/g.22589  ORF Transcript_13845/g.22589 Transcript_13845/m.22589 type:complete len:105 (+) Transcript_13845:1520-1834(+)